MWDFHPLLMCRRRGFVSQAVPQVYWVCYLLMSEVASHLHRPLGALTSDVRSCGTHGLLIG